METSLGVQNSIQRSQKHIPAASGLVQIAFSLTEQCGHKTFQISGFWADYGQSAPYPSLAVRARNGRVADHPEVILPDEEQAARDSSREAAFTYGAYWKFSA